MMDRNADLTKITENRWRIYGPERKMEAAEAAILGPYPNGMSQLDWSPFDADDDRPDECDRYIEWTSGTLDDASMAKVWQIAAALGEDARVMVSVQTAAFTLWVSDRAEGRQEVWIKPEAVSAALMERIKKATEILDGSP